MPTPDLSLLTYCRNDPVSGRWIGIDGMLSEFQCDQNIYTLANVSQWLLDNYTATVSLASVSQPTPTTLLFTFTDATTQGPFTLPTTRFRSRGDWAVDTPYLENDTCIAPDGGTYVVSYPHTSDPVSFDPNANDGMGHDFYAAMVPPRGNLLPAGGTTAMYFRKNSSTDYDANWAFITASEVLFFPSTGSALTSGNLAAVVEELEALITSGPGALSGLSDVNITEGPGIDGYFLTWNNASSKWVAAASSSNLSGLADVDVTEGPGIDGFFLQWNDTDGKWEAVASSSNLAGLADVNVTEGSGINGYFLTWDDGTGKWIAATSSLSGLADVNVTEGSGINGYFLKWDNGTGKWVASLTGATATALSGLSDVAITSVANNDDLHYDTGSSKWINGHHQVRLAGDTMTGPLTLSGDPASALHAATKQYVDGLALNLGKRGRVRAATTANITIATALNNGDTLDGVTLATNDLVLVKNQSSAAENGVYVVGVTPARFAEFDSYDEHPGSLIAVEEGSTNADTLWLCTSNAGGTLNSTAINFSAASVSGTLLAANNLSDLANAATARANLGVATGSIEVVIDGGGSTITTGLKGYLSLPIAGTITEAKLLLDQSGSIVVDVWKCTYAQFDAGSTHPVSGDKITASAPPTVTTATKSQDTTLTGWTTAFSAGDILAFNVNSVTSATRAVLSLKYTK